ncbi:MAG: type II toxin-antitoxin system Phd/YefM family antitoxin [Thermomicrobiales bacterium]|nr:type II toxin-antitoxin system Phd/YefM family antitoxin [Thermomicrobiales bacterium]
MKISEARSRLNALADQVYREGDRIVVEKSGIPVMAIISTRDLEKLQYFEANRDKDFEVLDRIREAFKDVPEDEIEREALKATMQVKADMRAEREDKLILAS